MKSLKNNLKILACLQKVIAMKRFQLQDLPRAATEKEKKDKQSRRFAMGALSRAVDQISQLDYDINSGEDAMNIEGIGRGIAKRIDEILTTGKLQELEIFDFSKHRKETSLEIEKVFGAGPSFAKKCAKLGIFTIADLKNAVTSGIIQVTDQIIQGILYYRDLQSRIPRSEMLFYEGILRRIETGRTLGKSVRIDLLGSFRRKAATCGDLDVLITSELDPVDLLNNFLTQLEKKHLLISHLSVGKTKFAGIIKHPKYGIARRIDVRYVPFQSYFTALNYFTGSREFNIKLRKVAISKGFKLSEYSLQETKSGKHIFVSSEKEIFDILHVPYVPPAKR